MTKFNTNLINFKIIISIITIVYFFSAKGHMEIIDTEYSIRTAVTVIEKQSLLIDPPDLDAVINFPDNNHPTKIYSKYGIGLWIIYLPFVALGKLLAFITSNSDRIAIDFLISFVSPCFGITGLFFFKNIQKNLGISEINSNLSIVVLGLSTFQCSRKYQL
jgi:hypothetical protein